MKGVWNVNSRPGKGEDVSGIQSADLGLGAGELILNEKVRLEIKSFLAALNSYPKRFSRNPDISFAEHCRALAQRKIPSKRDSRERH